MRQPSGGCVYPRCRLRRHRTPNPCRMNTPCIRAQESMVHSTPSSQSHSFRPRIHPSAGHNFTVANISIRTRREDWGVVQPSGNRTHPPCMHYHRRRERSNCGLGSAATVFRARILIVTRGRISRIHIPFADYRNPPYTRSHRRRYSSGPGIRIPESGRTSRPCMRYRRCRHSKNPR